jgi:hypothetical protein
MELVTFRCRQKVYIWEGSKDCFRHVLYYIFLRAFITDVQFFYKC